MRLILLSKNFIESAQNILREFTGKQNNKIRLAFCGNAGDIYEPEKRDYVQLAQQQLLTAGYDLVELDLNKDLAEILKILSGVDATFFTGGGFDYLMNLFNQSGLVNEYSKLLAEGLVHIGFSAGAMICSKDFKAYKVFPEYKKITKGLGLFPYYIMPHYSNKPKYTKAFEDVIKAGYHNVIPLTNDQGIIVDGNDWRIVE